MADFGSAKKGMDSAGGCSICTTHKDPATLKCGLYFCSACIGRVMGTQEASGVLTCPKCRSEILCQPVPLSNIMETFRSSEPQSVEGQVFCTNCIYSTVPAVKMCLHCDASLCEDHLRVHSKSAEHVLIEPTTSVENRKCSVHKEVLKYYCSEDATCICVSCCLTGKHKGHEVESLIEASKKKKLRYVLKALKSKREMITKRVQNLQERKTEIHQKAACLSKRMLTLMKDIKEQLDALEETILNEISKQGCQVLVSADALIQQLEMKKDEHFRKMVDIEKLCNTNDPIATLLQAVDVAGLCDGVEISGEENDEYEEEGSADDEEEEESDVDDGNELTGEEEEHDQEEGDSDEEEKAYDRKEETSEEEELDEDYEIEEELDEEEEEMQSDDESDEEDHYTAEDKNAVGDLDEDLISKTLQAALAEIINSVKRGFYVQKTSEILLDLNTAASNVAVCKDLKTATCSFRQDYPETPERFADWQVLSNTTFSSGRHYWEVESSKSGCWSIGIACGSIERKGWRSSIGYNNKSWCLSKWVSKYLVINDSKETMLPCKISCPRLGLYLDYEEGRLSFYELCDPVRHLHTFNTTFTEPLHAAFYVWSDWVKIIS